MEDDQLGEEDVVFLDDKWALKNIWQFYLPITVNTVYL